MSRVARRPPDRVRKLAPWLVVLAYLLLVAAWLGANPPGAAPDEPAHYVKALGAGAGDLAGQPLPPGANPERQGLSAATPAQEAWQLRTSRLVQVPPALAAPPWLDCNAHLTEVSSACRNGTAPAPQESLQATYIGTYQPFLYVAPGWAARLAGNASDAILLARGGGALLVLMLLALAVLSLWDGEVGAPSLLGIAFALTPMVVFLVSAVSTSGTEIAAGVCYLAAILRLARKEPATSTAWLALAVGGSVLSLSRSLGPAWVVLGAAALPAAAGLGRSREVVREGGRLALAAAATIVAASGLSIWWELERQAHPATTASAVIEGIGPALGELAQMYRQHIGVFGWLDTELPIEGYLLWSLSLAVLLVSAVVLGTARQRIVLAVLALGGAALTVVVSAALIRPTGFGMQARYVMPLTLAIPLFAGEVVRSQWAQVRSRFVRASMCLAVASVGGLQFIAWYTNARRQAVGTDGPKLFLGVAEWQPPLGWTPWMVLALAGAALLCTALALAPRSSLASPSD
jgi:hypothetical protein